MVLKYKDGTSSLSVPTNASTTWSADPVLPARFVSDLMSNAPGTPRSDLMEAGFAAYADEVSDWSVAAVSAPLSDWPEF